MEVHNPPKVNPTSKVEEEKFFDAKDSWEDESLSSANSSMPSKEISRNGPKNCTSLPDHNDDKNNPHLIRFMKEASKSDRSHYQEEHKKPIKIPQKEEQKATPQKPLEFSNINPIYTVQTQRNLKDDAEFDKLLFEQEIRAGLRPIWVFYMKNIMKRLLHLVQMVLILLLVGKIVFCAYGKLLTLQKIVFFGTINF